MPRQKPREWNLCFVVDLLSLCYVECFTYHPNILLLDSVYRKFHVPKQPPKQFLYEILITNCKAKRFVECLLFIIHSILGRNRGKKRKFSHFRTRWCYVPSTESFSVLAQKVINTETKGEIICIIKILANGNMNCWSGRSFEWKTTQLHSVVKRLPLVML